MEKPLVVVALGGNALIRKEERGTFEEQLSNMLKAAPTIAELSRKYRLVVTHGNGPQVGNLYLQQELVHEVPAMPLHACVAMTQSLIGYMIQLAVTAVDPSLSVVVIPTRVVVDDHDPAFTNPTKPIGPYYPDEQVRSLVVKGWNVVYVPGRGYRRVVPSPRPKRIVEVAVIRELVGKVDLVIAAGGGGIPVLERDGRLIGVDAVIDKDLASSLLAREIGAYKLVILTDVDGVYLDFGKPSAKLVERLSIAEAEGLLKSGYLPPGSMGPKVEACIDFARSTRRPCIIGSLEKALEVVEGLSGTVIY